MIDANALPFVNTPTVKPTASGDWVLVGKRIDDFGENAYCYTSTVCGMNREICKACAKKWFCTGFCTGFMMD